MRGTSIVSQDHKEADGVTRKISGGKKIVSTLVLDMETTMTAWLFGISVTPPYYV